MGWGSGEPDPNPKLEISVYLLTVQLVPPQIWTHVS
jgi:hypothetical protein